MTELRLNVTLTADGSGFVGEVKVAKSQLDKLTGAQAAGGQAAARAARSTQALSRQVNGLGGAAGLATRALAALGGALAVRRIVQTADTYKLLEGRLKLVTENSRELAEIQAELVDLANGTRSAYEPTVELFARVARNAAELNLSQRDLLDGTKAVNQAIRVGGSNASEAAAGVIQFSQALASGTLRGDELRSVMENLPRLAQLIADGLGTTIGGLRALSEAGQLTAKRIFDALLKGKDEIQAEFDELPVTVGQAFTVLGNQLGQFVAGTDKAAGTTAALANGILGLADNVELLAAGLAGLAAAGAVPLLLRLAPLVAGLANPLGLAALGVGVLTAAIVKLASGTNDADAIQRDYNRRVTEAERLTRLAAKASGERKTQLENEAAALREVASAQIDNLIAIREGAAARIRNLSGFNAGVLPDTQGAREAVEALTKINDRLREIQRTTSDGKLARKLQSILDPRDHRAPDAGQLATSFKNAADGAKKLSAATKKLIADLEFEASLIGKTAREREIAIALRKAEIKPTEAGGNQIERLVGLLFDEERAQKATAAATRSATDAAVGQRKEREAAIARGKAIIAQETALTQALKDEASVARKRLALAGLDERTRRIELRLLDEVNAARARSVPLLGEEKAARRELIAEIVDADLAAEQAEAAAAAMREPFNNAIEGIQTAFTDFFESAFEGGIDSFSDLASGIKRIFIRLAAEIATLLVFRPILANVLGTVGLGGLGAGLGVGQGGGGGGVSPLGVGQFGSSLARQFPSISSFLDTRLFGAGSLFSGGVAGTATGFVGAAGSTGVGGVISSGIGGTAAVGPTLGATLGAAGLGFAAGGLLGPLLGLDSTGSSLGGGAGAALGFAVGGPVGGLIGGALGIFGGGLLGKLFGGGNPKPFVGGSLEIGPDGKLRLARSFGQGDDKRQAENRKVLEPALEDIGRVFALLDAQAGVSLETGDVGSIAFSDVRGGFRTAFTDAERRTLFSKRRKFAGESLGRDQGAAVTEFVTRAIASGVVNGLPEALADVTARSLALGGGPSRLEADLALATAIEELRDPTGALTVALTGLADSLEGTARRAKELALPVDELIQSTRDQASATVGGFFDALVDPLRAGAAGLRFAGLAPGDRVDALRGDFLALQASAGAGNLAAIQGLPVAGAALVNAAEQIFAPAGPALAGIRAEVESAFETTAANLEAERSDLFDRFDLAIATQTNTLADRLDDMIAGLERVVAAIAEADSPVEAVAPLVDATNRQARAVEVAVRENTMRPITEGGP